MRLPKRLQLLIEDLLCGIVDISLLLLQVLDSLFKFGDLCSFRLEGLLVLTSYAGCRGVILVYRLLQLTDVTIERFNFILMGFGLEFALKFGLFGRLFHFEF